MTSLTLGWRTNLPTLHDPVMTDFSQEEQAILAKIAQRQGRSAEELLQPTIAGVQAHWPAWLETNHLETNQSYRLQGRLPQLAKEAIHVAVSMTNNCHH